MRFESWGKWLTTAVVVAGCGPTLGERLPEPKQAAEACPFVTLVPGADAQSLRAVVREESTAGSRVSVQTFGGGSWTDGPERTLAFTMGHAAIDGDPARIFAGYSPSGGDAPFELLEYSAGALAPVAFDAALPWDTHQLWVADARVLGQGRLLIWVAAHRDQVNSYRAYLRDGGTWAPLTDWLSAPLPYTAGPEGELQLHTASVSGRTITRVTEEWNGSAWVVTGTESIDLPEGVPLQWPSSDAFGRYIVSNAGTEAAPAWRIFVEGEGVWRELAAPSAESRPHQSYLVRDAEGSFVLARWAQPVDSTTWLEVDRLEGQAWMRLDDYENPKKLSGGAQAVLFQGDLVVAWTETGPFVPFEPQKDCELQFARVDL